MPTVTPLVVRTVWVVVVHVGFVGYWAVMRTVFWPTGCVNTALRLLLSVRRLPYCRWPILCWSIPGVIRCRCGWPIGCWAILLWNRWFCPTGGLLVGWPLGCPISLGFCRAPYLLFASSVLLVRFIPLGKRGERGYEYRRCNED